MGGDGNVRDAAAGRRDEVVGDDDDADVVADADEPPPLSRATVEALALMEEPDDETALDAGCGVKTFAEAVKDGGPELLVRLFESQRQSSFGVLLGGFARVDWLDEADPADLPAAADEIILSQAARLAIRSCARVENIWRTRVLRRQRTDTYPLDDLTRDILQERGQSISYYLEIRERMARIARVEVLGREKGAGARRRRPAKPAPCTPPAKG